ncbi:hypothetical protein FGG08_006574 [Glutinoglossum americanum]|uniref:Integral membrane protein n=1 Tax=Glutinoglossum americanum TaxID=1670608 RepID=A0A9P8I191_9PEZI|nr:hypothetical protein FGG08_006574 [Glutinoglossum americanum]
MPRNKHFAPDYEPFRKLQLRISGPFRALNPTRANFQPTPEDNDQGTTSAPPQGVAGEEDKRVAVGYEYQWRSRDSRKGRHALILHRPPTKEPLRLVPAPTASPRQVLRGLRRMLTSCPYWDVSYLVATLFTAGSVIWVLNGFFAYLPLVRPSSEFAGELTVALGATAFLGATVFEVGSVLLLLEAVNERREGCFGWALERVLVGAEEEEGTAQRLRPDLETCRHRHRRRCGRRRRFWGKVFGKNSNPRTKTSSEEGSAASPLGNVEENPPSWTWFPSWYDLRTHYLREIGFLASLVQFLSATIFWIAGFTALPGVLDMTNTGLVDGVFWTPQVIGGTGFVISGILFTLETQSKWWIPAPGVLGWHVGVWNLVGGIGFTLCGALGFASSSNSGIAYQSSLATFWGSWAFLVGSTIQWYESLSKYSVEVIKEK